MRPLIMFRSALYAVAAVAIGACSKELDTTICYSPTQNVDIALDQSAQGCACGKGDDAVCVQTADRGYVAFFCDAGRWHSGFDGPCEPVPKTCYSPSQNLELAYDQGAQGCACRDGEQGVCVQGVALLCESGRWRAVEDGPCAPTPSPTSCYSPSQNLELANKTGAEGCSCSPGDQAVCVDGTGLVCADGHWQAVIDGPCLAPPPPACYSPSQNLELARQSGSQGCSCSAQDQAVCVQGVGLTCADGHWQALLDGQCGAPQTSCKAGYQFAAATNACVPIQYSVEACKSAGGFAVPDPGDGSVVERGCPRGMATLGFIDAGWTDGGRCCTQTVLSCAPQKAHYEGTCEPAPRYFWTGTACVGMTGCTCVGVDCSVGSASEASCQAAFAGCARVTTACGARAGDTCKASEYCAYRPEGSCGRADAVAICAPRPTACDAVSAPVCGCDGKTYANECYANLAGTGLFSVMACN